MDNLLKIGFEQEIIDKMIEVNDVFVVEDLNENYTNTFKIISMFKELKIEKEIIDLLLVDYIDIFLMDYDKFIEKLKNVELSELNNILFDNLDSAYDIFLKE